MGEYISRVLVFSLFVGLIIWETVRPCKIFQYSVGMKRTRHGVVNIMFGVVGTIISYVLFLPLWHMAERYSAMNGWVLLRGSGMWTACVAVVLMDLWTYWWHRMNHRIMFLWRFHRMHHSDPWMDVTSAQRFHPGEMALSSLLRIPLIVLLGIKVRHMAVYDVVVIATVFFHHANIAVPPVADRMLRILIPTPEMHKVHHSRVRSETDSNYSALLSVWDRVFASFKVRSDTENISFGLKDFDDQSSQSPIGMLKIPVRDIRR